MDYLDDLLKFLGMFNQAINDRHVESKKWLISSKYQYPESCSAQEMGHTRDEPLKI